MDYANCIAIKSKRANHHSELTLKARSATVLWTTHVPKGLSMKDLRMAEFCEMAAREMVLAVEGGQEGEERGPCGGG
ncbi:uncharacterized protein BDW47DRAFT_63842 [Aspergillus candidus]|uniref:4a-hydroxytetrahydrobiopterin dehydratase n=1 Tax=Aspergillus candidus TaxID=41067 RepID=A0A2I2F3V2_ASPCN|nr:hypothetical protein BDW47DRAFT_63842 [Aspergillus candidus]PLB35305.1 hypothetical protein BDW47DRAFT_63842 [Aspergillus candidus]